METIYTVSALTEILRDTLEKRLPFVWVRGEISNLSRSGSGHIYFSLKDERSQLQCVWFAGRQKSCSGTFNPLTGEVYDTPQPPVASMLRNGLELLCAGGLGVYGARGCYQLLVDLAQPVGEGTLMLEFEKLKTRLAQAGYFALERKRPLPFNPTRIALVTSPRGAAIHDFLELAAVRGAGAKIRLFPVPVQGNEAAARMAEAIGNANNQDWAQAIVLIRGGGSLEDLWAFNEELLADAVFASRLPVIAGIGHEVDFTLADLTADVRAATPSHAAQLLWPLRSDLWQRLDELSLSLGRPVRYRLESGENLLEQLNQSIAWHSPAQRLVRLEQQLADLALATTRSLALLLERKQNLYQGLASQFNLGSERMLAGKNRLLEQLEQKLSSLNPAAPLSRGYAWLYTAAGPVTSVKQLVAGDRLGAVLPDGVLELTVASKEEIPSVPFEQTSKEE